MVSTNTIGIVAVVFISIVVCLVAIGWYYATKGGPNVKKLRKLSDEIENEGIKTDAVIKKIISIIII